MGAERCKKSVMACGGIEWGSTGCRKSGSQIADRKRVEIKLGTQVRCVNLRVKRSENETAIGKFNARIRRSGVCGGRDARREFIDLTRRTQIKKRRKQRGAQRNFAFLKIL